MQTSEEIGRLTGDDIRATIARLSENTVAGVDFWYSELAQRGARRATARAERLSWIAVSLAATAFVVVVVQVGVAVSAL